MINEVSLNKDFWKAICLHYEKECYGDALRDACMYIVGLIQEKSDNYDLDNNKLIDTVLSVNNPKLLINKNQTQSEKDEQKGFYYLVKGLICSVRNPLSHTRNIKYSKDETDAILLFINNILLPKLDDTKEFGYVDDWFEFIFVESENDDNRYSDKILESMSKKDKFELMKEIVEKIDEIEEGKYKYLINKLYNELTSKAQNEVCIILNRKLIKVHDSDYLRMFFDHFNPEIWDRLNPLATVRLEGIVFNSIKNGEMFVSPLNYMDTMNSAAELSTYAVNWINNFSNYDEIEEYLIDNLDKKKTAKYIFKYFWSIIRKKEVILKHSVKIIDGLKNGKIYYCKLLEKVFKQDSDPDYDIFKDHYLNFVEEKEDELPF